MYDQIREDTLYMMLYASVTTFALLASCYLLLRRANAIAPDVASPLRLRRWTAALFASITLSHLWYMPILFLHSSDDIMLSYMIGIFLDFITFFPLTIIVLLTMLQDRRRPLWPVCAMVVPPIVIIALYLASHSLSFLLLIRVYLLLLSISLITYMVQYGSWLRDNYADLEHKEVWQSFVVLAIIIFVIVIYAVVDLGFVFKYILQLNNIVLICYLLWRVETLSELCIAADDADEGIQECPTSLPPVESKPAEPKRKPDLSKDIELLLKRHCQEQQLYLQHDLTLSQLAKAVGINRLYLSQYFSSLGMNYHANINNLRIDHFVSLYHQAVASQRSFTAQQLARESGYKSYTTFREAFKRKMGLSVSAWMKSDAADTTHKPQITPIARIIS